jgi:glycine oxidase
MNNKNSPVTVVGTGIAGLAIAVELLQQDQPLSLIGPRHFDGAASPAAGAMIDTFGEIADMRGPLERVQLEARLSAQQGYGDWLAEITYHSGQTVFHVPGMFIVGNSGGDHDIEKLALMRTEMTRYQVPHDDVSPRAVPGLKSNVQFRAFDAIYMPTAMTVDSAELLAALQTLVSRDPRCDWIEEPATRLQHKGRHWLATTASGTEVLSQELILAAGAFSHALLGDPLWAEAGLPPLYYGRGASCIVTPTEPVPHGIRTPNRALACGIHMVPRSGGRLYLGATNLFGTDSTRATRGATVGELHTLLGVISTQLNTTLRNVSIEQIHWGLRPVTAHDHPLAGRTALDGLSVVTGAHRTGIHLAPLLARQMVAELLGSPPMTEPNPFAPSATQALLPQEKDFALGIRSLLATALYPDGAMPYNRAREVEVFIEELFTMALTDRGNSALRERIRQLVDDIAIDEQRMIRVFHEVLQERIPEEGPYVM